MSSPDLTEITAGNHRVLLIGLDGASWTLLDPLLAEGRMPRLAGLISGGVRGTLVSTIPPVTAAAWSSLYTGRSPGAHGVYDFRRRMSRDSTKREWITHCSIRGPKLWEIIAEQGKSAGLINLPLTFPPPPVNGYVIAGMPVPPARDEIGFPRGIVSEVVSAIGSYVSDIDLLRGRSPDVADPAVCFRFVDEVRAALAARTRAAEYLMAKYPTDFTACVFIAPDRLSHLFWKVLVPEETQPPLADWEKSLREKMLEVLAEMDGSIGRLVDLMAGDDLVFVVSDHGFGALHEIVKMNRLLADLGFLKFTPQVEGGLRKKVGRLLPEPVKRMLRPLAGAGPGMSRASDGSMEFDPFCLIDWKNTVAYSGGPVEQGVFLNVAGREPFGTVALGAEYHRIRDELIAALREVAHPKDGSRLFDWVEPRESVYSGECIDLAPDVVFSVRGYGAVIGEDPEPPLVSPWPQPRAGYHRREGIFVCRGPMVPKSATVESILIEDVAPTLLACWTLKLDKGMDGRIREEILLPGFLQSHPPQKADFVAGVCDGELSRDDSTDMEDLLKGLGYVS